jgi:hypothetical protein
LCTQLLPKLRQKVFVGFEEFIQNGLRLAGGGNDGVEQQGLQGGGFVAVNARFDNAVNDGDLRAA